MTQTLSRPTTSAAPTRLKDLKAWRELPPLPKAWRSLSHAFRDAVRRFPDKDAMVDTTGEKLTYKEAWLRAVGLARLLSKHLDDNQFVAVLLPPMNGPCIVEVALTMLGKIPINLNYTAPETIASHIKAMGVTNVISSKKVLAKAGEFLPPGVGIVDVEALRKEITTFDKAWIFTVAKLLKGSPLALSAFLPGFRKRQSDLAIILFTTGSTAEPKGVRLTHSNILTNVWQVYHHAKLGSDETVMGMLPFFHSLGYTVTMWTVLCLGMGVAFHFSPLETGKIGELMEKEGVTIMMCTPTLMRGFLRRCKPEQFRTVRWLMLGSEKMKPELARDIKETLGIDAVEGYGTTETAPVLSSGVPHEVTTPDGRTVPGSKPGSVGQAVPGTIVVAVDEIDFEANGDNAVPLPPGKEGLLVVKGGQVMEGYHNQPELTKRVKRNGWYNTGDIGYVDEDGFIFITDRADQFAKVGPEKVYFRPIEEKLKEVSGITEELSVKVTKVEDEKKGERIVVVYTNLNGLAPAEVSNRLRDSGLPALGLPGPKDFFAIAEMPTAGSGKLDLKAIRRYAAEQAAA